MKHNGHYRTLVVGWFWGNEGRNGIRLRVAHIVALICYFISGAGFVAWVIISLVRSIEDRPLGPRIDDESTSDRNNEPADEVQDRRSEEP